MGDHSMNNPDYFQPIFSVLIPTVPARKEKFDALMRMLNAQRNALPDPSVVEIVTLCDSGELMVGAKRNKLLEMAQGEYLAFIDDDDRIFGDYLERILKALETKPDVVGITIFWTDNVFTNVRLLIRSADYKWQHWLMPTPNVTAGRPAHLNPTRSDIAKSVRFPEDVVAGEDAAWSAVVSGKIKTCVNIDEPIYHYDFRTAGTITQRPGIREAMRPALPEGHQWAMRDKKIVELDKHGMVVLRKEGEPCDR
jgi:Glycosyl transferase family 2